MKKRMQILVRLPNWLGDLVMAAGFMQVLRAQYLDASIHVIVKKGLQDLVPFLPAVDHVYVFDKATDKGLRGALRFGRALKKQAAFDVFFCLPESFSSAAMGWATGAAVRVGFTAGVHRLLFTQTFSKPHTWHRAQQYVWLLEAFTGLGLPLDNIRLHHSFKKEQYVVANINSEAQSRRLTTRKAISLLSTLAAQTDKPICLIGAPKEAAFVETVLAKLPPQQCISLAGKTTLPQLVEVLAKAAVVLTTDSGPAHLANALGTPTVVLFGAGNEQHTAPFNFNGRAIIRLNELSCEPCEKNTCVRYATPQCLERLDERLIVAQVLEKINASSNGNRI